MIGLPIGRIARIDKGIAIALETNLIAHEIPSITSIWPSWVRNDTAPALQRQPCFRRVPDRLHGL
jgi:hypothetical protein